jgi:Mlc titration factor MtfA (ptsG expression regulator)
MVITVLKCDVLHAGYNTYIRVDVNIRMDLRETGWEGVEWMQLAQDRDQWQAVVNTEMNLRIL